GGCCGTRFVGHDPVPGHVDTTPNPVHLAGPVPLPVPPGPRPVPPSPSALRILVDFGIAPIDPTEGVRFDGFVFADGNRDGTRDPDEPGVPHVTIVGSTPTCPTFAPIKAETDADGHYTIVLPRCDPPFILHRQPVAGFVDTTPNPLVLRGPVPVA